MLLELSNEISVTHPKSYQDSKKVVIKSVVKISKSILKKISCEGIGAVKQNYSPLRKEYRGVGQTVI